MEFVWHRPERGGKLQPLDVIDGFKVRPGFYNRDGAASALLSIRQAPQTVRCCSFIPRNRRLMPG